MMTLKPYTDIEGWHPSGHPCAGAQLLSKHTSADLWSQLTFRARRLKRIFLKKSGMCRSLMLTKSMDEGTAVFVLLATSVNVLAGRRSPGTDL